RSRRRWALTLSTVASAAALIHSILSDKYYSGARTAIPTITVRARLPPRIDI
ncbi:hypothetical protein COCVIDRAFT_113527, partial [Bipolaris victoriae FI3]